MLQAVRVFKLAFIVTLFGIATESIASASSLRFPLPLPDQAVAYQHDASHTGYGSGPLPPLRRLWSLNLGALLAYPLIADGRVFVTGGTTVLGNSTLLALDAATGRTLWQRQASVDSEGWSGIAYDRGVVFATYYSAFSSSAVSASAVFAFDARTGRQIWSAPLPAIQSFASAPIASNGILYYAAYGLDTTVVALAEQSGATIWNEELLYAAIPAAAGSNAVVMSSLCESASAFGAQTGVLQWQVPIGCFGIGGVADSPVFSAGLIYVQGSNVSVKSGTILTSSGTVAGSYSSQVPPAAGAGRIFLLPTPNNYGWPQTLVAMDPRAIFISWQVSLVGDTFVTPPIVVRTSLPVQPALSSQAVVYLETAAGLLDGYDVRTGALLTSIPLGVSGATSFLGGFAGDTGLAAAGNILVVPAGSELIAFSS